MANMPVTNFGGFADDVTTMEDRMQVLRTYVGQYNGGSAEAWAILLNNRYIQQDPSLVALIHKESGI